MDDYIEIKIKILKDTYDEIVKICNFENLDNYTRQGHLPTNYTVNDFITGSVNSRINMIKNLVELAGYDHLGKPYQLKNRFKEIFQNKGLKQVQISKMTGIDRSNISMILANKNQPSLDYFIRLWVAADCPPIHEVLYRENQKSQTKN